MENTKIIHFLSCLDKKELREFGKFVRSPFHNNRKDVIRMFDVLVDNYSKPGKLTGEVIFKKLYPGKKYNPNTIVLLSAYLYNLGKQFLAIGDLKKDNFAFRYHFLKNLDMHAADVLFDKELRETEQFLNNEKLNKDFFVDKYLLEDLKINFNLNRNRQDKIYRSTLDYGDYLIYAMVVKLVVLYHGMLVDKKSFNYDFTGTSAELFIRFFNFEEFIKSLPAGKISYYNFIVYYYYLFMGYKYPENEYYFTMLKEYSFKNFENLQTAEKASRFHYLIEYCLIQLKTGNFKFLEEVFNLYK
jgi:hypothetical protein